MECFWGRFCAVIVVLLCGVFTRVASEQERLEEITHEPVHCERIDNSLGSLVSANDGGSFHGRMGERVLLCDCQNHNRQRRNTEHDEQQQQPKLRKPPFVLLPFPATTSATDILIVNCHQLLVPAGTFRAIRAGFLPRTIRFTDIDQLTVESFAFETSGNTMGQHVNVHDPHPALGPIDLRFQRCHLEELPANVFHGAALRSVQFGASSIGAFRSLAIGIRLQQFLLANTEIGRFDRHAFKRAQMEQLVLQNVTLTGTWTSQAWHGLIANDAIRITNSIFWQTIPPAAITESSTDELLLQSNVFADALADEAFQLAIKNRIRLIGNQFGQLSSNLFRGIRISNETAWNVQPEILLERNLIDTFQQTNDAGTFFAFPRNFSINVQTFRIAELATCDSTNVTFAAWPEIYFLRPFATTPRTDPESYISVEQFRHENGCDSEGPDMVLVIVLATLLGVTILGAGIGGFWGWRYQRKKRQMLLLEQNLVQPVPRTYRETQILLKLETVGTLKTDF